MSLEAKENKNLQFKKIDVSFIYGYVNYKENENDFKVKESDFKTMWSPTYRLKNDFFVQDIPFNEKHSMSLPTTTGECCDATLTTSAYILRKREGGAGSLTIKITIEKSDKNSLDIDMKSVFRIINLIPRTSDSTVDLTPINFQKIEESQYSSGIPDRFSSLFRLFCVLLLENQKCWSEFVHKDCNKKECDNQYKNIQIYDCKSKTDPQIPYILIEGELFKDEYNTNFMGEHVQSDYTHEIGCLLGRWLSWENRDQLSKDYYKYYNGNDEIIGKNDAFINMFRDKKTYTIFSSLLTLLLKSEYDGCSKDPDVKAAMRAVELTTNTVKNYLEFSRSRLHHSLWLNKQLDWLIAQIDDEEKEKKNTTRDILGYKKKLNNLKTKVAKFTNNPISYMWDNTVLGQEMPALKIDNNVDSLEKDTIKKLGLISDLISDKIQNAQILDYIDAIEQK